MSKKIRLAGGKNKAGKRPTKAKAPAKAAPPKKPVRIKPNPAKKVLTSAVADDASSLSKLDLAYEEMQRRKERREKALRAARAKLVREKLKQELKQLAVEGAQRRELERKKTMQEQMRDAAKQAGALKQKAKQTKAAAATEETEEQRRTRLANMVQRSLAEREAATGTNDPEWEAHLRERDKRRAKASGGRIGGRDPYARARHEITSGAVDAEGFEPDVYDRPALAGGGGPVDEARRVQEFMARAKAGSGAAPKSSKTESDYSTSPGKSSRSSSGSSGSSKTVTNNTTSTNTSTTEKLTPVVIEPRANEPLFDGLGSITQRQHELQKAMLDRLDRLIKVSSPDKAAEAKAEVKDDVWRDEMLEELSERKKEKSEKEGKTGSMLEGLMGVFGKLRGAAGLVGLMALKSAGPKIAHGIRTGRLKAESVLAMLTGNKEWAASVKAQQAEHAANDPGDLSGLEWGTLGLGGAALLGGRGMLGVAKGGFKLTRGLSKIARLGGKGLLRGGQKLAKVLGRRTVVNGAVGAALEGGAASATRSVVGRSLVKGLLARAGARFVATQAAGSLVPGAGNLAMGIAATALTVGDIVWSLMSDEQKDQVKKALSKVWAATKEMAVKFAHKLAQWTSQTINYVKDLWAGEDLGSAQRRTDNALAAHNSRDYSNASTTDQSGNNVGSVAELHRQALSADPAYAEQIKRERSEADAQGKVWDASTSPTVQAMLKKRGVMVANPNLTRIDADTDYTKASKDQLMQGTYAAFRKAGYSDEGARAMVGQVGRENDFRQSGMFGAHTDRANGKTNAGFLSWQKDRRTNLDKWMRERDLVNKDGTYKQNQAALDAMAAFHRYELERGDERGVNKRHNLINRLEGSGQDVQRLSADVGRYNIRWDADGKYSGPGFDPRVHARKASNYVDRISNQVRVSAQAAQAAPTVQAAPATAPVAAVSATPTVQAAPTANVSTPMGLVEPTYERLPMPAPATQTTAPAVASAQPVSMPNGSRSDKPSLFSNNFVEDGMLQYINQVIYG